MATARPSEGAAEAGGDPGATSGAAVPVHALPWIDWIRFLAALEVFLFHLRLYVFESYDLFSPSGKNPAVQLWFALTHFGGEAVLVFFALSGYLVGGGLIQRIAGGTFRPLDYAVDRATRLLLPFLPAMAVAVGLQWLNHEPVVAAVVAGNIFSLQGVLVPVQPYLGVDWSLAFEFWFYVLGGATAVALGAARGRTAGVAVAALALLVFCVLGADLLFCWLIGALFSQIAVRRASVVAIVAGLVVTGSGLFLLNALFAGLRHALHLDGIGAGGPRIVVTIGFLMVIRQLVALRPAGRAARSFDRLGTRLAAFSYSLYLIHVPVLALLVAAGLPQHQDMTARSIGQYGAYVGLCLAGAYGFYWLFERHTDSVRRAIKRRLRS